MKTWGGGGCPHAKERGLGQSRTAGTHSLRENQPGRHLDRGLLAPRAERQ